MILLPLNIFAESSLLFIFNVNETLLPNCYYMMYIYNLSQIKYHSLYTIALVYVSYII